jgi:pimeloyl-ACP methyl ester carboxylesterase
MTSSLSIITKKKHDRTITSASAYWLSKMAFHLAPDSMTRVMREKGFAVKPYHLNARQHALQNQAHSFYLDLQHNKIKVYEWGNGPVVLLAHGWGGRALQMDAFVPALLKKGRKVVAFDQKGHGESSSRFSSFLEIVRTTELLMAHYAPAMDGLVAHSIGSNAAFKVSEKFERPLKMVAIAPMENFPHWLESMRIRIGIDEKLFARVIVDIESDTGLNLLEQCELDFARIRRHAVLLVHDKYDRLNNIRASHALRAHLPGSALMETERQGHARILDDPAVVERVVGHLVAH